MPSASKEKNSKEAIIVTGSRLIASLLALYLQRFNIHTTRISSPKDLKRLPKSSIYALTIAVLEKEQSTKWLKELKKEKFGHALVFVEDGDSLENPALPNLEVYSRPINFETLETAIAEKFESDATDKKADINLSGEEQSLLAARITAAVYEKLLLTSVLQDGQWEKASKIASHCTVEICKQFENLIQGKK